jgi:hemoglobin
MNPLRVLVFIGVCLSQLVGCTSMGSQRGADSLYANLGEVPGISRLVDALLFEISEDHRIVEHFADADPDRLREKLIEQICMLAGGHCEYTGEPMQEIHAGLDINEAHFNFLVEDLQSAMAAIGLPLATQNHLLARLAPLRTEIIYR